MPAAIEDDRRKRHPVEQGGTAWSCRHYGTRNGYRVMHDKYADGIFAFRTLGQTQGVCPWWSVSGS
ncbi:MAG: hypothetical protein NXI02_33565, partial [Rhodobacteraceae bacterium]|nr:hypothetical protein [Paracoccaceae bacterium]